MAFTCHACGGGCTSLTLGFNERDGKTQEVCFGCERTLGPSFKKAVCRKTSGSRTCIIANGRPHIHTTIGPLYPETYGASPA